MGIGGEVISGGEVLGYSVFVLVSAFVGEVFILSILRYFFGFRCFFGKVRDLY